jgi:hypothetical protein
MSSMLTPSSIQPEMRTHWREKMSGRTTRHFMLLVVVLVTGNVLLLALMISLSNHVRDNDFTDSFDDPTLPGWEHTAHVRVINGVLRVEPGNGAFIGCCWGNLSLTVRARRLGNGFLSISYRAGDMGAYNVEFGDTGVSLARLVYGNTLELASAPVVIPAGAWVTLHVTAIGNSHTISLNGKVILEINDPNPFPPNMIGLINEGLEGATGEFDDLRVIGDSRLEVAPNMPPSDAPNQGPDTAEPSSG